MASPRVEKKIYSKPEAYLFIILNLRILQKNFLENYKTSIPEFDKLIEDLKIAFENHEQTISHLIPRFLQIKEMPNLDSSQLRLVNNLILLLEDFPNLQYPKIEDQFQNLFQRRFESELAVNLLLNPTDQMMESVGKMSNRLIKLLDANLNPDMFHQVISDSSKNSQGPERFGVYQDELTREKLIDILKNNKAEDLALIMQIHYNVAFLLKNLSVRNFKFVFPPWENSPVGMYADFVKKRMIILNLPENEFDSYVRFLSDSYQEVICLSDEEIYGGKLYLDKGRKGLRNFNCVTTRPGILLENQNADDFLKISNEKKWLPWVADVLTQTPDFESKYVQNLLVNDGVYVAGPSGMTSLLFGLMELVGNLSDLDVKQNYLTAMMAFIVSGGFHSIHEVLEPAAYCLNLIPDYHAGILTEENNYRSKPPNYHVFFDIFKDNKQFQINRDKSWSNLIDFAAKEFGLWLEQTKNQTKSFYSMSHFAQKNSVLDEQQSVNTPPTKKP